MSEPRQVQVCIVGGGPAGIVLGYLLARCGISTLVLEGQPDFDRDFRGDTLHAGVMEVFQSIGLAERILELPHFKIPTLAAGGIDIVNFGWLKTEFPFVTMMAQSIFLDWLTSEAKAFPTFEIEMGASARELLRDSQSGPITGVTYRKNGELIDVQAPLVVACDGRSSRMRKEAKLEPEPMTDPLEVLWFRLPRLDSDQGSIGSGALTGGRLPLILLERPDHYQIAAVIKPGSYSQLRSEGLEAFHQCIREASPGLFDRAVTNLANWKKIAFLHVEGSRLKNWHVPGMLLIGDAAHVMTPVGGVGINYAIWDAVETANVLVPILKSDQPVDDSHLVEIQRRREGPTKIMQTVQRLAGRRVLTSVAAGESERVRLPAVVKLLPHLPGIRTLVPKLIALGWKRTHCQIQDFFDE